MIPSRTSTPNVLARFGLTLVLGTTSLLAACSHGGAGTTAAEVSRIPELPLEQLVDPSAVGAVHVDLATVAASPYYANLTDWIDVGMEGSSEADQRMVRIGMRAREFVIFLVDGPDGVPRTGGLLRGHYAVEDALAFHNEGTVGTPRNRGPFVVNDVGTHGAAVLFGTHTLVLGDRDVVNAIVDRQIGNGGGGYPRSEGFAAIASRVDFSNKPIGFVVVPSEAMRSSAGSESDPILDALGHAEGLGFGLDVRGGLHGRAVVDLGSAIVAMGAVTVARARMAALSDETDFAETGLGPILSRIELGRDGTSVVVDLASPEAEARQSFSMFTDFLRRANH